MPVPRLPRQYNYDLKCDCGCKEELKIGTTDGRARCPPCHKLYLKTRRPLQIDRIKGGWINP